MLWHLWLNVVSALNQLQINIWNYASCRLLHSIETGHSANIFCTKFIPETSDELVASGAGDAEVCIYGLCRYMFWMQLTIVGKCTY